MTGFLLDSHVLLWLLSAPERLGTRCRADLESAAQVRFSSASIWELRIKADLGKVTVPDGLATAAVAAGLRELPVTSAHVDASAGFSLPHRDPFDRLLLGQADHERLALLTADRTLLGAGLPFVRDAAR